MVHPAAMNIRLHYDDKAGWSLRTPRDVVIFGPTWSRLLVEAYAQENGIPIPDPETEDRPVAQGGGAINVI